MAESEPVTRARGLTNIDSDIISTETATTLEETAKDEILSDTSQDSINFTDDGNAKSALMWLLIIFFKIHIGEIESDGYSIGDVETKDLSGQGKVLFGNYRSARNNIVGSNIVRHAKPTRSGREYGSDR